MNKADSVNLCRSYAYLRPLPPTPFRYPAFSTRTVHPDGCVEVAKAWTAWNESSGMEATSRCRSVVMIPKPDGSERPLGIPAVRDRVAGQAALNVLAFAIVCVAM